MTPERMTPERGRAILDAYGADSRRWPAHERDAALDLMRKDKALRQAFDEAFLLDQALDALPQPALPRPNFEARLLAAAPAPRHGFMRLRLNELQNALAWRPAMTICAVALIAGFWAGGLYFAPAAALDGDLFQSALLLDGEL